MRVLCILLPHFPLACELHKSPALKERPVLIVYACGSQKLVLDHSPEIAGLQRDMPLQQALSLARHAELVHADMPHYQHSFDAVLDSLEGKSPEVEGAALGLAYIGLDGLQQLYGDDHALIGAIQAAVPQAFAPRMGIAANKFLSYLAALHSPAGGHRLLEEEIEDFLKEIPCDILPVPLKTRNRLCDFGLRTLGQVAALSPGPLQAQFGPAGKRIWELARGYDETPLYPRMMQQAVEECTTLPAVAVSLEAILAVVESLLARIFTSGMLKGRGIRSFTLWTQTWDAEHWERSVRFKEPALNTGAAMGRTKHVLESFPQPGPVEQVGIRITGLGYGVGRQKSLFPEVRAEDHLLDDIRQLEFQMGGPCVFKIKEIEPWSRIPERRYALTPLDR